MLGEGEEEREAWRCSGRRIDSLSKKGERAELTASVSGTRSMLKCHAPCQSGKAL